MKLYKLDEYPGELPNPKSFPVKGKTIVKVKDKAFTDGVMLDIEVRERDIEKLKQASTKTVDPEFVSKLLSAHYPHLLSEPMYIYETDGGIICYILTYLNDRIKTIQVQYYAYFCNRYPGCQFYVSDAILDPVVIKSSGQAVGLVMPMMVGKTLSELEEWCK